MCVEVSCSQEMQRPVVDRRGGAEVSCVQGGRDELWIVAHKTAALSCGWGAELWPGIHTILS